MIGLGAGSGVVAVAAGANHALALRADGAVLAWGGDHSGQLGDGGAIVHQPTPVPVSGLGAGSGVVAIAANSSYSLALRSDGAVLAWGADYAGVLGNGATDAPQFAPVPSGVGAGSGVVAVPLPLPRPRHRGLRGLLGWNAFGQLGDGTTTDRHRPGARPLAAGALQVSGGAGHTLVTAR